MQILRLRSADRLRELGTSGARRGSIFRKILGTSYMDGPSDSGMRRWHGARNFDQSHKATLLAVPRSDFATGDDHRPAGGEVIF